MALNEKAYNPEIAHCEGVKQAPCKNCLRLALFETWQLLPADRAESIILLKPRANVKNCPCRILMPFGYEKIRNRPAQVEFTATSYGYAI